MIVLLNPLRSTLPRGDLRVEGHKSVTIRNDPVPLPVWDASRG
jgi:hypothetical protein